MAEIITTAGAAGPEGAAPVPPSPEQRVEAAKAAMFRVDAAPTPPAPAPEPPPDTEVSMAEIIRQNREARQAAQSETQRRSGLEAELKAAREELAKHKAVSGFEDDPVGYAKARGWSKEQQLLYGQSLLYDLAPEKADPDFRVKMFEDRYKREKDAEKKAAEEREAQEQVQAQQRQLEDFFERTVSGVRSFAAGSYPESEDWFGNDLNAYMQSLMATAEHLAKRATAEGRVADLSAAALASVLEAETSRRLSERDGRRQKRQPAATAAQHTAPGPAGQQPVETLSTKNMTGSGAPQPPAASDKERIQRAIAAGFQSR